MKRKLLLILFSGIICLSGCRNTQVDSNISISEKQENMAEAESEEENAEKIEKKQDSNAGQIAEHILEETSKPTPTPDKRKMYKEQYDYQLYVTPEDYSGGSIWPMIIGFNFPYVSNSIDVTNDTFPDRYNISTDDYILVITADKYEITEDNKLIYPYISDDETSVEEKGEIDTVYGPAKLYFTTCDMTYSDGSQEISHDEIAVMNVDGYAVTILYSRYFDFTDYTGELAKLLPTLFEASEVDEEKTFEFEQNNISVNDSYEYYLIDETFEHNRVFGFNIAEGEWLLSEFEGLGDADNEFTTLNMFRPHSESNDFLCITQDIGKFNYYFGGKNDIEIEEKIQVDTPFGIMKVYYVICEEEGTSKEYEVAVINNLGINVVMEYYDSNEPDGVYNGALEEVIPQLFE